MHGETHLQTQILFRKQTPVFTVHARLRQTRAGLHVQNVLLSVYGSLSLLEGRRPRCSPFPRGGGPLNVSLFPW